MLAFNVTFLRPTRPGRVIGRGRDHRDGDVASLETSLLDCQTKRALTEPRRVRCPRPFPHNASAAGEPSYNERNAAAESSSSKFARAVRVPAEHIVEPSGLS
jgi:hypothetical protein